MWVLRSFLVLFVMLFVFVGCGNSGGGGGGSPQTYTVTFYNGDSLMSDLTQTVNSGMQIDLPSGITKTGHAFDGWLLDNSGSAMTGQYTVTYDVAFYAKWTLITYNATFESNGGDPIPSQNGVTQATEPTAPTRTGYIFVGWFANSSLTGSAITFPYNLTSNITLYAKWAQIFNVTFESNGGDPIPPQNGVAQATEPTAPTRLGYTFVGWFANSSLTGSAITFPYTLTADTILYAKWLEGVWISISTPEQLNDVRNNLSGDYILMNDISLAGYSTGEGWQPIGNTFGGKFNGNGYKITDLTINRPTENIVGLFASIDGAAIINLGVEIGAGGVTGGSTVGGMAGRIDNSTITNCYSTGDINANVISNHNAYSGGIAGFIISSATITNCYSSGSINAASFNPSFPAYSGGIAGGTNSSTITNCATINPSLTAARVGSVAGFAFIGGGAISNNFALNEMILAGSTIGVSNARVSKTDLELRTQSTYSAAVDGDGLGGLGWKFGNDSDNPWKWVGTAENPYPILYWQ